MTPEEIRAKMPQDGHSSTTVLIEIAAQLAEISQMLRGFANGYLPVGLCATNDVIPVLVKEL